MTRKHLIAAAVYNYSYQNYEDHLGIGNQRFERLMPESATVLAQAVQENWPRAKAAAALDTSEESAEILLGNYRRAMTIIDAENPAESFRTAIRLVVQDAVADGLSSEADIERLVIQICYRAADLAYLLKMRGESLARYSRHLRKEPDVEYYEGYFDEDHD
jgi:hypothetical protein